MRSKCTGVDWRVTIADYNATTNPVALAPAGCGQPTVNATGVPSSISFSFECDSSAIEEEHANPLLAAHAAAAATSPLSAVAASSKWSVVVEYNLPIGAASTTKQLKVGLSSGEAWMGTILSVEIFRGMPLGAGAFVPHPRLDLVFNFKLKDAVEERLVNYKQYRACVQ